MKQPIRPAVYLRLLAGAVLPAFREAVALRNLAVQRPRPGLRALLLPTAHDLTADATARAHTGLGFGTALRGAVILGTHDPASRTVLAHTPNGLARFQIPEINFDRWLRLEAGTLRGGRGAPAGVADVTICFPHFRTALAAQRGELDEMAALGAGELVITGSLPLADHLNVVLQRMA
ncbi:MAG: hypothetical protein WCL04_08215, partial [Verrucomicrobiota bacterium]